MAWRIKRVRRNGGVTDVASGILDLAEASAVVLRLYRLQEQELGGDDEFITEPEED